MNRSGLSKGWIAFAFVGFLGISLFVLTILHGSALGLSSSSDQAARNVAFRAVPPQALAAGNAEQGRSLFMGDLHFENGGPPCMGCHNIGRNGLLGGGALGPDLTDVSTRLGPSGVAAKLASPGPVMLPIYAEHPLTSDEQADLLAFMEASAGEPAANNEWLVIGVSTLGLLGAVALVEVVYHRRLHGIRKPMLREARSRTS